MWKECVLQTLDNRASPRRVVRITEGRNRPDASGVDTTSDTPWKTIPWTLKATGWSRKTLGPGGAVVRVYVCFRECTWCVPIRGERLGAFEGPEGTSIENQSTGHLR